MDRTAKCFIDGVWQQGGSDTVIRLCNPATEGVIDQFTAASTADLDQALTAAESGLHRWGSVSADERGGIFHRTAEILRTRLVPAAEALTREQGKPLRESAAEWQRAIETFEWAAQAALQIAPRRYTSPGLKRIARPEPVGVVAAFTPWNYPAVVSARKLAFALAAGCSIVLKAAEQAPSAAIAIISALVEAGLPTRAVNLVFGDPPMISAHLLGSGRVQALTFTGSTVVGKHLAGLAATKLVRCVLELGGHSPVVVLDDVDVEAVAAAITAYKFECAGQSCNAPSRVYVHEAVYRAFCARISDDAAALRIGNGRDSGVDVGPLAHAQRVAAVERLVADARDRGARVLTGGSRPPGPGYFYHPTILADVPDEALIMRNEPFGPVLPVTSFTDIETVVARANRNPYGLAAYVFSTSIDRAAAIANQFEAGSVGINHLSGVPADAPVSGIKASGYGYEGGFEGIEVFLNRKLVSQATHTDERDL